MADFQSINDINWFEIWQEQVHRNFKTQSSEFWDKWAKQVEPKRKHSPYADVLISLLNIESTDTVLDVGCGTGAMTIPLARVAKKVYAFDQSENALSVVEKRANAEQINNIELKQGDWHEVNPIDFPNVDVVLASRSLPGGRHIKKTIHSMNEIANKSCHLTWRVRGNDELDIAISKIINIDIDFSPEHAILYNVIESCGIHPRVTPFTIVHEKEYMDIEDAYFQIVRMREVDSPKAKQVMDLLESKLVKKDGKYYQNKETTWVLFSWDKNPIKYF